MKSHLSASGESASNNGRRSLLRPTFFIVVLLFAALAVLTQVSPAQSSTIPTFSITSVVTDTSVTIRTSNFPANQNFVVTMGAMGTKGVGGVVVGTTNSGAGGAFNATYNIPAQFKGARQVAIRLQTSHASPYYAFNWFWNNTSNTGTGGIPGYTGIPTFEVVSVQPRTSVTIRTANFPPNQIFTVTMGAMGTRGVNGVAVGTLNSGVGGALTATFNIPAQFANAYQVAIRAQTAHAHPYFAYNWFYNDTTGTGSQQPPPTTPPPVWTGTPTFTVCGVVRDTSVTIRTKDFPPNQSFTVTMGAFGTQGVGGYTVGTLNSGVGGTLTATFNIPAQLVGSGRIAIRAQTGQANPFFAYNWFWNNTATVC